MSAGSVAKFFVVSWLAKKKENALNRGGKQRLSGASGLLSFFRNQKNCLKIMLMFVGMVVDKTAVKGFIFLIGL